MNGNLSVFTVQIWSIHMHLLGEGKSHCSQRLYVYSLQ